MGNGARAPQEDCGRFGPLWFLQQFRGGGAMAGQRDILSVGIDIGTSTTQVIFSRIAMENTAGYFTIPKVSIVEKEVVYRSEIYTTPLLNRSLIDGDRVREMVAAEFARAGFTPADTDTGAVIITGESARKENSALVLEKLSGFAGEFVVSTAGPDLEAIIAGKGSGAQQYSEEMSCTAVNLDIGGGTTNIALFDCGRTAGKGCLDIGGRLIRLAPDRTVTYISPAAALVAEARGVRLREGEGADLGALREVCRGMAQLLEECLGLSPPSALLRQVQTPGSSWLELAGERPIRAIFFSGGVADGVYRGIAGEDPIPYGDIGLLLGEAIREGRLCTAFRLVRGRETIRATVVGAGSYTTTLSGSTITYTDPGVFPFKNVPVVKLTAEEQEAGFCGEAGPIGERVRWFLGQSDSSRVVIGLEGEADPSYRRLKALAGALARAAGELPPGEPLLLVVESDIAKALGQAVAGELGNCRPVVALDSIQVEQNDYIDIGKPLMDGLVVPVVVKTLIFG